jgi:hypothetical protein
MSKVEPYLQDARKAYRLASDATNAADIERHALHGRDCLVLAHNAAKVVDNRRPSFWAEPLLGTRHE